MALMEGQTRGQRCIWQGRAPGGCKASVSIVHCRQLELSVQRLPRQMCHSPSTKRRRGLSGPWRRNWL